jgi:hypothetical protein
VAFDVCGSHETGRVVPPSLIRVEDGALRSNAAPTIRLRTLETCGAELAAAHVKCSSFAPHTAASRATRD